MPLGPFLIVFLICIRDGAGAAAGLLSAAVTRVFCTPFFAAPAVGRPLLLALLFSAEGAAAGFLPKPKSIVECVCTLLLLHCAVDTRAPANADGRAGAGCKEKPAALWMQHRADARCKAIVSIVCKVGTQIKQQLLHSAATSARLPAAELSVNAITITEACTMALSVKRVTYEVPPAHTERVTFQVIFLNSVPPCREMKAAAALTSATTCMLLGSARAFVVAGAHSVR
jgi:hypothetical protein